MSLTPIIANLNKDLTLTVQAYNDGIISFGSYETKTEPCIVDACRHILNTVGLISGVYAARPYPLHIMSGSKVVFIVPTVYFGSRKTQDDIYSDIELVRGISFCGQMM